MSSKQGDIPALESSPSSGFLSALASPIGILRRSTSYDDSTYAPHSPTEDFTAAILWNEPPRSKERFKKITENGAEFVTFEVPARPPKSPVPVVKSKAGSIMNSLMIKQTQDKIEQQGGLMENVQKGLSAEEMRIQRLGDSPKPKLRMPSGDFKEDRLTTSAQATPSGTPSVTPSVTPCVTPCVSPHSSPALTRRSWLQLSPTPFLTASEPNSPTTCTNMGGNEGSGGERWSLFGTRSGVQKSPTDPGSEPSTGFSLQSYFGVHKSTSVDTIINLKVDDPAKFMAPKIEIQDIEAKRVPARPHRLKPRDMNVLTPSGF